MNNGINSMDFQDWFSSQEGCMSYLVRLRWEGGYCCPRCGWSDSHYYLKNRGLYQCKRCKYQASATSGTIFDNTRAPLPKWFNMIFLLGRHKGQIPILKMAPVLDLGYKASWVMAAKIRKALEGKEDLLCGESFDQGAFDAVLSECLRTDAHTFSDLKKKRSRSR